MAHTDEYWMQQALAQARLAAKLDEVPVGAVVVLDNQRIGAGYNQPVTASDPTAHAEIVALRQACLQQGNYRLPGCTLYVTIEPCTMCMGALVHARVKRLVFGAREPKAGAACSKLQLGSAEFFNHDIEVSEGVLGTECGMMLSEFFAQKRAKKSG